VLLLQRLAPAVQVPLHVVHAPFVQRVPAWQVVDIHCVQPRSTSHSHSCRPVDVHIEAPMGHC
jgi:hypothetical protein